ncbi:MAG: hypothetical protein PF481_00485 [Bacteroidales bacterium]|jgi:hypothetical protein|nr:hypothetical protein [Bacteroidales bacterium]
MRTRFINFTIYGIIFCILSISCEKNREVATEDFLYINKSSHVVSIDYYFDDYQNNVVIEENDSFLQTQKTPDVARKNIINADSVIITFNDTNHEIYIKTQSSDRNILNRDNYSYQKVEEMHHKYTYLFDDEG